jgi:hypothetical protein
VFGRLERQAANVEPVNGEPSFVLAIIMVALGVVAVTMVWSLALAWRQSKPPKA